MKYILLILAITTSLCSSAQTRFDAVGMWQPIECEIDPITCDTLKVVQHYKCFSEDNHTYGLIAIWEDSICLNILLPGYKYELLDGIRKDWCVNVKCKYYLYRPGAIVPYKDIDIEHEFRKCEGNKIVGFGVDKYEKFRTIFEALEYGNNLAIKINDTLIFVNSFRFYPQSWH